MSDKELVSATITALAAIDAELGLPEDGCNSTARTLTAIRLLHSVHRDDVAEIERLHEQMERGTAALRVAFGEELWRLGHPAYVVVHMREEIEKVTRLWKAATVERDALRASLASAEAEVARLTVEAARHETEMGAMIDERDEMETALSSAHTALGEDGEWACRIPSPPPPDSGHLCLDVPALAERVATENAALLARVEAAEKDAARAREFLLAFINGGANQDFRLWARALYAAMREGGK